MKNDIPRNSMRIKVKDLISFNIKRKAKKNTLPCPWRKFGSGMRDSGCKTQAIKNFEKRIIWQLVKKEFKRCFIIQQRGRKLVNEIGSM